MECVGIFDLLRDLLFFRKIAIHERRCRAVLRGLPPMNNPARCRPKLRDAALTRMFSQLDTDFSLPLAAIRRKASLMIMRFTTLISLWRRTGTDHQRRNRSRSIGHGGRRTGSGKTTLANLLARFYDPVAGSVSMDGIDMRQPISAIYAA